MSGQPSKEKSGTKAAHGPSFDQARDELFSHILRCGVLDADGVHQKEWMDDTMQYLGERYTDLSPEALTDVRVLGDRFCRPVVARHPETVGAPES